MEMEASVTDDNLAPAPPADQVARNAVRLAQWSLRERKSHEIARQHLAEDVARLETMQKDG